jgi:Xaa-Pro aminopeptidase
MRAHLIEIDYPSFGDPDPPPVPDAGDLLPRLEQAREAMRRAGFTHLVIYGDREHFANLHWLTHFDPRFEEALLILDERDAPLILVGNECQAYLAISPLHPKHLRSELFPPFSLPDQPQPEHRHLREILHSAGIGTQARVGCVGWKLTGGLDLPAFIADEIRALTEHVRNATALFQSSSGGLRATVTPLEIAQFEYANVLASQGLRRILFALREGASDFAILSEAHFNGYPQSTHWGLKTGARRVSLSSPRGAVVERGTPVSANISYWGANCCRAGWAAASAQDLPPAAANYLDAFAKPYFMACVEWIESLQIGAYAADLTRAILARLPQHGIVLNPGHLIHQEEWLSSPFTPYSHVTLRSGMAIQSDIIPSSPVFGSARLEDTWILADARLQASLELQFPAVANRIAGRREFLRRVLGIQPPAELLPLSDLAGIMMPFWFAPRLVFARS